MPLWGRRSPCRLFPVPRGTRRRETERELTTAAERELTTAHERELEALLEGCLEALEEEIRAVRDELHRRGLDRPLAAAGGALLDVAGPGFRYVWTVPAGLEIRPDDGARIRAERGEALGFVTSYDRRRGEVRLAVSEWLGRQPGLAELEFDPTWLLGALADRLQAILDHPGRFHPVTPLRLLGRAYPKLGRVGGSRAGATELNSAQRDALARVLGSDAQFVWGPPGTGKTRLLGHVAAELAHRGRVLVVATTNGALDEAAARIAEAVGGEAVLGSRIVRVGAEFSATGDPRLSLSAALERRIAGGAGGVEAALRQFEEQLRPSYAGLDLLAAAPGNGVRVAAAERHGARGIAGDAPGGDRGLWGVRSRHGRLVAAARVQDDREALAQLERIGAEIQKQAVLALRAADVLLSTLAGLTVREELASLRFDSVIIDEASTAPLPYIVWAASLARRRAIAMGDFQQLPAVVVSRAEAAARWLGRDAFREAGIVPEAPPGELPLPSERDRLCATLVEQYRMAPPIRSLVSDLFYGGRLRDAPTVLARARPNHPLVLVDTASLDPKVERAEGSRANAANARSVGRLLEAAATAGIDDVAVVVPYRLQARRLGRLVRGELGRAAPRDLEISTVHRFQGREKSVVIFDTVDAPPARSWFLHEGRNRELPRLLNVALSRTRDMLIVVGTAEGLRRTLPEHALLNRLLSRVASDGIRVDARALALRAPRLFRSSAA